MNRSSADPLEARIDAFEQAQLSNVDTDLGDFLPPGSDPEYATVAVELMRIDLERRWERGIPKSLDDYRNTYGDVLAEPDRLSELAYEEYRCRVQAGQSVSPHEYVEKFSIPVDHWPAVDQGKTDHCDWQSLETIDDLGDDSSRLVDAIQLFPGEGDQFLDFQLLGQLGQGTFGTVFLAKQAALANRQVVLKISTGHSVEPQHLARLQHANIVPIYSVHQHDQLHAVCMPYFGRTTLADVIRGLANCAQHPVSGQFLVELVLAQSDQSCEDEQQHTVDKQLKAIGARSYVDAVVQLAAQVAAGLEHAHQQGILHRDIKPANVLLTDAGCPMLLDFNVSDEIIVGGHACLVVGGTWPYMSPEQRRSMTTGQAIDQRSDVYSLGVLLYQLLCRQLPHSEAASDGRPDAMPVSLSAAVEAAPQIGRREIQQKNSQVPPSVAAIVRQCLHPNRERRYQSMSDLKEDLQRHLEHRPLRFAPDRSPVERFRKWCRRHPRVVSASTITAVSAGLLILAGAAATIHQQQARRFQAVAMRQTVEQQLPQLRVLFGSQEIDAEIGKEASSRAMRLIETADPDPGTRWEQQTLVRQLSPADRDHLRSELAELYFLVAGAEVRQAMTKATPSAHRQRAEKWNQAAQRLYGVDHVPAALIAQQASIMAIKNGDDVSTGDFSRPLVSWTSDGERSMLAQQLMEQGRYAAAVIHWEELRAAQPFDFSAWFLLGNCYVALSRLSDADGCFTTCASLWPDSYLAWFNRGLCRFQLRQFDTATADFDRVLELRPDFTPALFNRALCRKGAKEYAAAVDDLERVIKLQGARPRTLLVKSRIHELMGEDDLAAVDRQTALQTEPVDAKGWLARGLARVDEAPELALQDIQQAQRLAPQLRQVGRNLAYVYGEHLNRPQAAADILADLIQRYENPEDMMARGVMLARIGQRDKAIGLGKQALEIRRDGKLAFQMACIYALSTPQNSADAANSVAYLAEAISLDPAWLSKAMRDPDLESVRKETEFRTVVHAALTLHRKIHSIRLLSPPGPN